MTNFTPESKSQLAKLMATENIIVQHQKVSTASFNVKQRILYLPIWKDMSGDLYDLLTGHEVGHALFTPIEGWHDTVVDNLKTENFKHFLNVVEDARIEKKIQRRYPGLKSSFVKAYQSLFENDFFGIAGKNVNELPFIDRLNIYTKSQYTKQIVFTDYEKDIIERVKLLEDWDDVVNITKEIFEYSKKEQYQMMNMDHDFGLFSVDVDDEDDDIFGELMEISDDDEKDDEGYGNLNSSDSGNKESDGEEDSDDAEEEKEKKAIRRNKKDVVSEFDDDSEDYDPVCETDMNFREKEKHLLDASSKPFVYVNIPKPNLKNIITPAKIVQQFLTDFYSEEGFSSKRHFSAEQKKKYVDEFKSVNERFVSLLAKEFEMKKAAKIFSKSKLSETGDIDVNKLSNYKFDDNIFRKVVSVPKGKSHGLILLLDGSGSMDRNMAGAIEQIIVLTMFCRKVNIPFKVFSFNNHKSVMMGDLSIDRDNIDELNKIKFFSRNDGEMEVSNFKLREYVHSDMSNHEYNKAISNMIYLRKSYEISYDRSSSVRPDSEKLSNTPLNSAIIAVADVIEQFKKKYNLDMASLVIVHDGDSDNNSEIIDKTKPCGSVTFDTSSTNVVFQDSTIKYQSVAKFDYKRNITQNILVTENILKWFSEKTKCNVIGFFIVKPDNGNMKIAVMNKYMFPDGKVFTYGSEKEKDGIIKVIYSFRENKFVISNNVGYDKFFFVAGGEDMILNSNEIVIEGKITTSRLKTAFMKMQKKRKVSRVLVSKFIEKIAI